MDLARDWPGIVGLHSQFLRLMGALAVDTTPDADSARDAAERILKARRGDKAERTTVRKYAPAFLRKPPPLALSPELMEALLTSLARVKRPKHIVPEEAFAKHVVSVKYGMTLPAARASIKKIAKAPRASSK